MGNQTALTEKALGCQARMNEPSTEQNNQQGHHSRHIPAGFVGVLRTFFFVSTVFLLLITAAGKTLDLTYAWTHAERLVDFPDALLPFLKSSTIVAAAAVLDLLTAGLLWHYRCTDYAFVILAYFVSLLLFYRFGLWTMGAHPSKGCHCLGAAAKWVRLSPTGASRIASLLIAYWVLGLCAWAGSRRRQKYSRGCNIKKAAGISIVVGLFAPIAQARHLELQGIYTASYYYENGVRQTQESVGFTVWLSSNRWCIKSGWNEAIGIGSNTFDTVFANSNIPAGADVHYGFYPVFSTASITIPWLAFCSGTYFKDAPTPQHLPTPWRLALTESVSHIADAEVSFLDDITKLPRSVTFRTTSQRMKQAGSSDYLRFERLSETETIDRYINYARQYPPELVIGRYHVLATTNFYGSLLPQKGELRTYVPRGLYKGLTGDATRSEKKRAPSTISRRETFMRASYAVLLTNLLQRNGDVSTALLPKRADVVDYRLQSRKWGVDHVLYSVADGRWKVALDPQVEQLFDAKIAEPRSAKLREDAKRAALYTAFCGLILFPLALLVWRKTHHKQVHPPQTL